MAGRLEHARNASGDTDSSASQAAPEGEDNVTRLLRARADYEEHTILQYADIVMDLTALRARRGGRPIQLSPTEFRLLRLLLEQPERAFTRAQLKAGVWGHGVKLEPRSINTCLGRLRRALTARGEANVIRTITGYGYSLDATLLGS